MPGSWNSAPFSYRNYYQRWGNIMSEKTADIVERSAPAQLIDHDLVPHSASAEVLFEKRPARNGSGDTVPGLYNVWITLNNPGQYNSYTTDMVKAVILAFRAASNARDVNAVVFTGAGTQAFCTGGNTREYAEYYAGNPQEYRQYMRLFNDMVSAILGCDKPVICRVNGMRIGGGQEIGMACDFTVAQDLANFGQAGPKHGSAAIGGATDFLPVMVHKFKVGRFRDDFSLNSEPATLRKRFDILLGP